MEYLRKLFKGKPSQPSGKTSQVPDEVIRRLSPLMDLIEARRRALHGEARFSEEERSHWIKILRHAPAQILQDPSGLAQENYVKDVLKTQAFLKGSLK